MLCVIPARGNSKRLPRKNLALLSGKPLIDYAIEAAFESGIFSSVCVTSDDTDVLVEAGRYLDPTGNHELVHLHRRKPELATDAATVWQVCLDVLDHYEKGFGENGKYGAFCVLLPTSPLRTAYDVRAGYELFVDSDTECVMSVTPFSHPPQHALIVTEEGKALRYEIALNKVQSQFLEPLYRHDGSFIFCKTEAFRERKEFYGLDTLAYVMLAERAVDINTQDDLDYAEWLLTR